MILGMDLLAMDETIQTLHPDSSKRGTRISHGKYELVRASILEALRVHGPMSFAAVGDLVVDKLQKDFDGSVTWYFTAVELDLEARGEIRCEPNSGSQMIEISA